MSKKLTTIILSTIVFFLASAGALYFIKMQDGAVDWMDVLIPQSIGSILFGIGMYYAIGRKIQKEKK